MPSTPTQGGLPPPLTPAFCDLQDFEFMPLSVKRLRDSDLAALQSPEECWAAVLLWSASWHQVPAASLPDDDRVLANLAGYGRVVAAWLRVRQGALHGFVKCADGRLYHPVVAEKANDAWREKVKRMHRTECARITKHNQRYPKDQLSAPSLAEFIAGCLWISTRNGSSKSGCPPGQEALSSRTSAVVHQDKPPERGGNGLQGTGTGIFTPPTPPADKDPPRTALSGRKAMPVGVTTALSALVGGPS